MSGNRHRLLASEDGASAVEFALCVPVFLMMVFGIIQFGWTQHTMSSVRFGMERASRAFMLDPNLTQSAAQTIVDSSMSNATRERVTVTLAKATTANGPMGTLSASYTARFGIPGLATFNIPYQLSVTTALRNGP